MYKTVQGDMFDYIAFKEMGDCLHTQNLLRANRDKLYNFDFNAGVDINIPTVTNTQDINLPPWRK